MRRIGGAALALSAALAAGCGGPLRVWDMHTTSTPRPQSLDVTALAREPVATLGIVAPAGLQGLSVPLARALADALTEAAPPMRAMPAHETLNQLTEQGLTGDYGDLVAEFARSGTFDSQRLRRIGSALRVTYVLQPGVAEFSFSLADKFEFAGWKILRTRVTSLRLWLRLWDVSEGRILWESAGEAMMATQLLRVDSAVPLDELARNLWLRMIQHDLLEGRTKSRWYFSD